jgi:hypothetical protein
MFGESSRLVASLNLGCAWWPSGEVVHHASRFAKKIGPDQVLRSDNSGAFGVSSSHISDPFEFSVVREKAISSGRHQERNRHLREDFANWQPLRATIEMRMEGAASEDILVVT